MQFLSRTHALQPALAIRVRADQAAAIAGHPQGRRQQQHLHQRPNRKRHPLGIWLLRRLQLQVHPAPHRHASGLPHLQQAGRLGSIPPCAASAGCVALALIQVASRAFPRSKWPAGHPMSHQGIWRRVSAKATVCVQHEQAWPRLVVLIASIIISSSSSINCGSTKHGR